MSRIKQSLYEKIYNPLFDSNKHDFEMIFSNIDCMPGSCKQYRILSNKTPKKTAKELNYTQT